MDVGLRQTRGEDVESRLAGRSVLLTFAATEPRNYMLEFLSLRSSRLLETHRFANLQILCRENGRERFEAAAIFEGSAFFAGGGHYSCQKSFGVSRS